MTDHRQPRSTAAAAELCERYAELDAQRVAIGAELREKLATITAEHDQQMQPVLDELEELTEKLAPWWDKQGAAALTDGKRKSAELGGCEVGTRKSKSKVTYSGKCDDPADALDGKEWAADMLRTKVSVITAEVAKALFGPHKAKLRRLGFGLEGGEATFFIKRVDQGGTMGK